jgi:hypothetical protein
LILVAPYILVSGFRQPGQGHSERRPPRRASGN